MVRAVSSRDFMTNPDNYSLSQVPQSTEGAKAARGTAPKSSGIRCAHRKKVSINAP